MRNVYYDVVFQQYQQNLKQKLIFQQIIKVSSGPKYRQNGNPVLDTTK
jgi:hypothetical protein